MSLKRWRLWEIEKN